MEAQTSKDKTIPFRVFDYSYKHAASHREDSSTLYFPQPIILYFGENKTVPDTETIMIKLWDGSVLSYDVDVFKVLDYTLEELDQMHLVLLIPFLLLKFRKKIKKSRSPQAVNELQTFILHDIIETINKNIDTGISTEYDAIRLQEMTRKLYRHLYSHYKEFQKEGGLNDMIEDNFALEVDRLKHNMDLEHGLEVDRINQEHSLEVDRIKQEHGLEVNHLKQKIDTLEKKSVLSIFKLTKNLLTTAAELNLSVPQVQKYLNESQVPYQAI